MGLQPRAVSRDLDWGIPVPAKDAEGKVLYVWFDAPIGYISNTKEICDTEPEKYGNWEKWWKDPESRLVHFIGKDNIVFHCIVFPAMSGGTENIQTFVSLSTRYQDGFFKNSGSDYRQHDLKANVTGKINNNISVDVDFSGRLEQGNFLPVGSATLFYELQSASPLLPARWPNGLPGPPLDLTTQHNPVVQSTSAAGYKRTENYVFNLTTKLNVKIPCVADENRKNSFGYLAYSRND